MKLKIINQAFCVMLATLVLVPLVLTDLSAQSVSEAENRGLTVFPSTATAEGWPNLNFLVEFDRWFSDRIGLRSFMIRVNGVVQYYCFGNMSGDVCLGPNGEFNYATDAMIADYQHFNLRSDETVARIAAAFAKVSSWVESNDIQFYYFQCWDKHSVCPEQFPVSVFQYGSESKTDQVMQAFEGLEDFCLINPKNDLINAKSWRDPYGRFSDPSHWAPRGAYIGYLDLMQVVNGRNNGVFRVLDEEDYNLELVDLGKTYYGAVHEENWLEAFEIKDPKAHEDKSRLTLFSEDKRHRYFVNEAAGNDVRVLICGDSYFNNYLVDDIAESFGETVLIWGDYLKQLPDIIDAYEPDILIIECAERVDRTTAIVALAEALA